eukprot:s7838_g1.t1
MASWVLQNAAQGPKPHPRSRHCGTALGASGRPLVVKGQPEPRRAACVVLPLLPLLASRFRHRPAQGPGFRRLRRRATAAPSDDSRVYAFSSVDGLWPKSPAAADLGFFVGLQGSDQDFVVVEPADAGDAACNWRERLLQLGLFPDGGLPQVVGLQQALDWRLSAQNWVPWTWSRRVFQELGDSEAAKNCESWHQTHGKSWAAQRCYEWHEEFASELEERFGQQSSGGNCLVFDLRASLCLADGGILEFPVKGSPRATFQARSLPKPRPPPLQKARPAVPKEPNYPPPAAKEGPVEEHRGEVDGYIDSALIGGGSLLISPVTNRRIRLRDSELLSVPPEAHEESLIPGTAAAEALEMSSQELGSVGVDWDCDMMTCNTFCG